MPFSVLFDLDDTLLSTNMGVFIPAYFDALGEAFSTQIPVRVLIDQIHQAVEMMDQNQDPCLMLGEIFTNQFYLPLGLTEEEHRQQIDEFYYEDFPNLRHVTQTRPEAQRLIEWCNSEGITIAIATNPLFPEAATRQRIEWAGLNPSDFVFFSTFNNFHFTKPKLTYFAECLGRLGWPEGNIVMVGDNLTHDLQPMQTMGFPTFWVTSEHINSDQAYGTLSEVRPWLEKQQSMDQSGLLDIIEINLAILRATPAVLDSWIKFLPSNIFSLKPAKDEWNFTEVIWHLADLESEVYLPQWRQLAVDIQAHISWPDTSRWAEQRGYRNYSPEAGWKKFCQARLESLDILEDFIKNHILETPIQHTTFSRSTIRELLSFCARHDRIHLHQCKELVDIYKIY